MSNVFTCPHCGATSEIEKQYLGQKGPCYHCEQMVAVPKSLLALDAPQIRRVPRFPSRLVLQVAIAGAMLAFLLLAILLLRHLSVIGNPVLQMQIGCRRNLEQIAIAMNSYHDQHGSYPPAYFSDDLGKPIHSWRVLLLPHLGFDWLYEQYRFDEPWNSDHNLEIVGEIPTCFACPFDPISLQDGETNYMVIVGPETMFPGSQSVTRSQLIDGAAKTMMVVEVPGARVAWTEPVDLQMDDMRWQINSPDGNGIGSFHESGARVVAADGQVYELPDSTSADVLRGLVTIKGGEADGFEPWSSSRDSNGQR